MSSNYVHLKKKYIAICLLTAILSGIGVGFLAVGVLKIVFTFTGVEFSLVNYLFIAVASFIVVGGIILLFNIPSDKKIAQKIDREFDMHEKVQTMIEFKGVDNLVAEAQRKDTDTRIAKLPHKGKIFKKLIPVAICFVLSCIVFLSGIFSVKFVQGEDSQDDGEDVIKETIFEYTIERQQVMNQMIGEVGLSDIGEQTKELILDEMQDLHEFALGEQITVREVKQKVIETVGNIDTLINQTLTYRILVAYVVAGDINIYNASVEAIGVYKQYSNRYSSLDTIKKIYEGTIIGEEEIKKAIEKDKQLSFESLFNISGASRQAKSIDALVKAEGEELEISDYEKVKQNLQLRATRIKSVLGDEEICNSYGEYASDDLRQAYLYLADELLAYADKIDGTLDIVGIKAKVSAIYDSFAEKFQNAMLIESYNCIMRGFIRNKVASIFGVDTSELPFISADPVRIDDGGQSTDPSEEHGGGGGTGETLYGSDDKIFNPDINDYVSYGEILDERSAKMREILQSSDLSDEVKKAILDYFNSLSEYKP